MEPTINPGYKWINPSLNSDDVRERMNIARDEHITTLREQIHETCKRIYKILGRMLGYTYLVRKACKFLPVLLVNWMPKDVLAAAINGAKSAEDIRKAFAQIMDVATAIAEPILWFYAVTACVLMVTGRTKTQGWEKLKNVGYAYIILSCMDAVFAFFRWIAVLIKSAISMQ